MDTTRSTLLLRVRQADDQAAWKEFFALYFPLLEKFAQRCGLDRDEAEEIAQSCMDSLVRRMRDFNYSPQRGKFKSYLFRMVSNKINTYRRRKRPGQLASEEMRLLRASEEETRTVWEGVWLKEHLRFALKSIESGFAGNTVAAFKLYALKSWPVEKVAAKLDMTANQVYLAKSRVTARLRKELTTAVGKVI